MAVAGWCCKSMPRDFVVVIILFSLVTPAQAQIYKWTDEAGAVHYSSQPHEDAQSKDVTQRVRSTGNFVEVKTIEGIASNTLTVLSTTWCTVCKKAKAYLNARGVSFTELDVEKNDEGRRRYRELKGTGVPIILVGNQRMNGFSETRMEAMLKKAGLI